MIFQNNAEVELRKELQILQQQNVRLLESEKKIREILENSLVACYKRNLKINSFEYLSPVFNQITGYELDEIKSLPVESVLELIHPEDFPEVKRIVNEFLCLATKNSYKIEYRFRHKDNGEYCWLCDKFTVMIDSDGCPEALIGSITDITERKLYEEKLIESNKRLQGIFNNLQDAYFETDAEGKFTVISPSASSFYGYPHIDELIGSQSINLYADPMDRESLMSLLSTNGSVMDFTCQAVRKDKSTFWASMNVQFKYDNEGQFSGCIGVVRDITERKNRETELEKKLKELQWYYDVAIQRELKMVVLKAEINDLLVKLGEGRKYSI